MNCHADSMIPIELNRWRRLWIENMSLCSKHSVVKSKLFTSTHNLKYAASTLDCLRVCKILVIQRQWPKPSRCSCKYYPLRRQPCFFGVGTEPVRAYKPWAGSVWPHRISGFPGRHSKREKWRYKFLRHEMGQDVSMISHPQIWKFKEAYSHRRLGQ